MSVQKCDAKGCGSPAEVNDRMGGHFCRGHSYLATAGLSVQQMTDDHLRAGVNEFTQDDPPPYGKGQE